jgi:hypothetical protein
MFLNVIPRLYHSKGNVLFVIESSDISIGTGNNMFRMANCHFFPIRKHTYVNAVANADSFNICLPVFGTHTHTYIYIYIYNFCYNICVVFFRF